eukprot:sb/3472278/
MSVKQCALFNSYQTNNACLSCEQLIRYNSHKAVSNTFTKNGITKLQVPIHLVQSDPYLVTPHLVTPLFSDTIFFPHQNFHKNFKFFVFSPCGLETHVTATNNLLLLNLGALPQTPSLSGTPGLGGYVQPLTNTQYISRSNFSSNQSTMTPVILGIKYVFMGQIWLTPI